MFGMVMNRTPLQFLVYGNKSISAILVYGNRSIFAVLSVREQEYICSSWFTGTVICLQFLAYGNMSIGTRLCVLHNGKRFTKSQSNW